MLGRLLVLGLRSRKWLIAGLRSWRLVHWLWSLGGFVSRSRWRWRGRLVCGLLGWGWLVGLLWRLRLVLNLFQHRRLLVDVDGRVAGIDYMRCWRLSLRGLIGRL